MKNADMLVKLYDLPPDTSFIEDQRAKGIFIAVPTLEQKAKVVAWVGQHFSQGWVKEVEIAFSRVPVTCFVAKQGEEIIGFCCYDTSALGFCGPIGLEPNRRQQGTGKALLLACLHEMKRKGYGYAVIGWVQEPIFSFYEKTVGAVEIPNSFPGIYRDRIANKP